MAAWGQTRPSSSRARNGRSALDCGRAVAAQQIDEECHFQTHAPQQIAALRRLQISHSADANSGLEFVRRGLLITARLVTDRRLDLRPGDGSASEALKARQP